MKRTNQLITVFLLAVLSALPCAAATTKPVRVFILAGQSNMEGAGLIKADPKRNGGRGSLEFLVKERDEFKGNAVSPLALRRRRAR